MPLVKEDLRQIEELFEELLAKKADASVAFDKRSRETSASSFSSLPEREIFERILNVELELKNQRDLIEKILHQIDKRFEQVDKRFEQVDKRFEQVDKRFEELREDMNRRFEQVDKRFEQVDKRFGQLFWFIGLFIPLSNSLLFLALSYVLK